MAIINTTYERLLKRIAAVIIITITAPVRVLTTRLVTFQILLQLFLLSKDHQDERILQYLQRGI